MADEFIQVELSTPTSDYALVIFNNTLETYPTDRNIECSYTITSVLEPSTHDWIGIYKVGWRSTSEYHCFDWSRLPADYNKASSLPQDNGEFYQFCYVTGKGHVRGASTPFQFRKVGSDEYVEVEDEDDDILVIKTKTAMLEDKLSKVEQEKEELSKVISESLEDQKNANTEMVLLHNSMKEKIATLNQEKDSCVKRLDDSDEYINSLQQKIKMLVNEKDALIGRNRTLEEEKELFNKHFASSEDRIKGYTSELDDLRQKLRQQEETSADLRKQIQTLQDQLGDVEDKLKKQIQISEDDKMTIGELTEKLHNCEDKLAAAEKCKELLNEEVKSLKQTLDKLSKDLEKSTSECHNYKTIVNKQKERFHIYTEKMDSLQKALNAKEEATIGEYRKLKEMNWEQETREKKESETVKDKMIDDMKERLRLGQEQYKERVIECKHLQKELKKALNSVVINMVMSCDLPVINWGHSSGAMEEKEKRSCIEKHCFIEMQKKDEEIEHLTQTLEEVKQTSLSREYELQSTIDGLTAEVNQLKSDTHPTLVSLPANPYGPYLPLNHPTRINICRVQVQPYYPSQMAPRFVPLFPTLSPAPPIPPRMREFSASQPSIIPNSVLSQAADIRGADAMPTSTTMLNDLDAPIPHLPPPLTPEKSPEAKTAELRAITEGTQELQMDDEEERFHDAEEDPNRAGTMTPAATPSMTQSTSLATCPFCNMVFSDTAMSDEINEHVECHLERVCPICSETFDRSGKIEDFQSHVDRHFTD
ncbi:hypothetical protein LSH36_141g01027 [Paralvinella palmiformis]|uniref:SKICH domain-containing protein n=1 Tax=Paralvinella palmiformis TaxID=53620 RepID=A0AAD9JWZ6_9ANNE|nr:hypothetical protein LSH36_141g01027 [Paralvinella palmiformis]